MQIRKHVHAAIAPDFWPRCSEVHAEEGLLFYRFGGAEAYDIVRAYQKEPHIEFLNCQSAEDFCRFLRRWGPLLVSPEQLDRGWATARLRSYEAVARFLRTMLKMMDACRRGKGERESLIEFIAAFVEYDDDPELQCLLREDLTLYLGERGGGPPPNADPAEWAREAGAPEVRKALALLVETWFRAPNRWGLRVSQTTKGGVEIKPSFELYTLLDGLRWMIFYDEWNRRSPTLCAECPTIFRPSSMHEKIFCSPECAHRSANRRWRRKDLKGQTRRRRKGGANVTRKAR